MTAAAEEGLEGDLEGVSWAGMKIPCVASAACWRKTVVFELDVDDGGNDEDEDEDCAVVFVDICAGAEAGSGSGSCSTSIGMPRR